MDFITKGKWDSSSDEEEFVGKPVLEVKSEVSLNNDISTDKREAEPESELVESPLHTSSSPIISHPTDANSVPSDTDQTGAGVDVENPKKKTKVVHHPLLHGCRSVEEYKRLSFIDQGTYGMVFKARCHLTGDVVALKQMKPSDLSSKVGFPISALRETNILLALKHPNIIRVREMVVGSSIDKIFMVMDYYENDLKRCMELSGRGFSLGETKRIIMQLADALNHMHSRWYLHRDLKTSNILYDNKTGQVAICDFGMSRKYGSPIERYTREVVTLWYRPPELLLGADTYSYPMDMWSLGCIFAEILTGGKPLFAGQGEADQINRIFTVLGAPTEDKWPGANQLLHFDKVSYRVPSKSRLREYFPSFAAPGAATAASGGLGVSYVPPRSILCVTEQCFDLLSNLLHVDPKQRYSSKNTLDHEWLLEDPKPTPVDMMPQFNQKT